MKRSDVKFRHAIKLVVKKSKRGESHICNTSRSSEKVLKK